MSIFSKLDRVFISSSLSQLLGPQITSHSNLQKTKPSNRRFIFERAWFKYDELRSIISQAWDSPTTARDTAP
jgi:hypothetical protein